MSEKKVYNVISYGGGTQSTALVLLALEGKITPRPDFGVFADVGGDPEYIMAYVEMFVKYVKEKYDFDIHIVRYGDLSEHLLGGGTRINEENGKVYATNLPPLFRTFGRGNTVIMRRQCTSRYKIYPQEKFIRNTCGVRRGRGDVEVIQWFGMSFEEASRMRISHEDWSTFRYPLIEMKFKRLDSIKYVEDMGLPRPERSSCYFCPFSSNEHWKRLKQFHPTEFNKAVEIERSLQKGLKDHFTGEIYLTKHEKNLDEIDFNKQFTIDWPDFSDECFGMCGA